MSTLGSVLLWVMPSVLVAVAVGFYLAWQMGKHERFKTIQALMVVLQSTEQLETNVTNYNTELEDVGRTVREIDGTGRFDDLQEVLLSHISGLRESNKRLEEDLICARYQMEKQAQELDRTRREVRTDTLTGVANRKAFDETLHYWMSSRKRHNDTFSLVIADIDHFKWINDTHGHPAGDHVIGGVANFLRDAVRADDYVARFGGDEFVLLLRHSDASAVRSIAERLQAEVGKCNFHVGTFSERIAVTVSMGLATVRVDDTVVSLVERADRALYKAKGAGRNQLVCHDDETTSEEGIPCPVG